MSFDLAHEPALADAESTTEPAPLNTGAAFAELGLAPEIVKAIAHAGYPAPTEVQARAVPAALTGRDLLVSSQTGSGKTAAFVWPALQRILDARLDPAKKRVKGQPTGHKLPVWVRTFYPATDLQASLPRACLRCFLRAFL